MWQCLPGALNQAERSEWFQAIRQSWTSGVAFLKLLCYDEWLLRDSSFYLRHCWEALALPLQTYNGNQLCSHYLAWPSWHVPFLQSSSSTESWGDEKWCWDKLEKMLLIFSKSRNLLCISMASWISVSTWGAPKHYHFGEISLCFERHLEAMQYCSCSYPVAQLLKAALFVSHYSFMVLLRPQLELLLLPSLSRKLFETVRACLLLHPEVNVTFLVATPEAREHDRGSGIQGRLSPTGLKSHITCFTCLVICLNQEINFLCVQGWSIFLFTYMLVSLSFYLDKA